MSAPNNKSQFLERLRKQAESVKSRRGSFGTSFRPEDGKHVIRIFDGQKYPCTNGGIYYDLYQHWIKVENKNRPFNCMARTGVDLDNEDPDTDKCPACVGWDIITRLKEGVTDGDYTALIDKARRKLSFRSAAVFGIAVRTKATASNPDPVSQAIPWSAPMSVAEQVLTMVSDNMADDDNLDPFDDDRGNDWVITRETANKSTTYKVSMRTKASPVGELDGEQPDLQKHFKAECQSGISEKNVDALIGVVDDIVGWVFDAAADYDEDVTSFVAEWKAYLKHLKNRKKASPTADDDVPPRRAKPAPVEDDDIPPRRQKSSAMPARETTHRTLRGDDDDIPPRRAKPPVDDADDDAGLASATDAIAAATALLDEDD